MTKKERVKQVLQLLDQHYPEQTQCYLHYQTDWQLLVATILSAQCTDDRVNQVTPGLFQKYPSLADLAGANLFEMEAAIQSTGFYRNKAKNIIFAARMLLEVFQGEMPQEVEELVRLPGVGRKTANVVRSHIFHLPSIVVDTHVKRVSFKLGLTKEEDPEKVEFDLMKILPKGHWIRYNTQIIAHGRKVCKARKPECLICCLQPPCRYGSSKR